MSKYLKTTTFGLLAASLIFSQAAFADGSSQGNAKGKAKVEVTETIDATVETETDTETTVTESVYGEKADRIEAKLQQFLDQDNNEHALAGKLGSIENRKEALEKLAEIEKEIEDLDGTEEEETVDALVKLYADLGELEKALQAQQKHVQKLDDSSDEVLLKEYKEIGKLLKQMGKVGVKALVNGVEPQMDVAPVIEDGRTLVPFRALAEALDAEVEWNAETKTVTVTKDGAVVVLTIDSMVATVDGKEYKLDVPAKVKNGRTVVPLRFLSQGLKAKVLWEQETQTAIVIDEEETTEATEDTTADTTTDTAEDTTEDATTDAAEDTTEDTTTDAAEDTTEDTTTDNTEDTTATN